MKILNLNINNIHIALEVLQYIIDNDDDININFSDQKPTYVDKGSTKDIMMRVKRTLETGIFGFKHHLPDDLQEEAYETKECTLQNYLGRNKSLSTDPNVVPYFEVVDKLITNISNLNTLMDKKEEQAKMEVKNMKRQLKYKDKTIETLEDQLAQLQKKSSHPIFDQYNTVVNENEQVSLAYLNHSCLAFKKQ